MLERVISADATAAQKKENKRDRVKDEKKTPRGATCMHPCALLSR